jgi:hypothetical protein
MLKPSHKAEPKKYLRSTRRDSLNDLSRKKII